MAIQNHLFQPLQWNTQLHSSIYLNTPLGFMRICCAKFENWSNYGANKSQHFSLINHVKM